MTVSANAAVIEDQTSFAEATTWGSQGPNRFRGNVDPCWSQGRAVFGGVVGAGLARAMHAGLADDKALRSFSAAFVGPVEADALECETEVLREGKSATFVRATLAQSGSRRATATATFARARRSSRSVDGPVRPDAPAPNTLDSMPYVEGITPRFIERLELKYVTGAYPFMGSNTSRLGGWCRFRLDRDPGDVLGMLGLIDAWPSPAITMLRTPAPSSSITWNVDFAVPYTEHRIDEWWYWDAETAFVGEGYSSFSASLWAPDGRFVARSSQLVGVFER